VILSLHQALSEIKRHWSREELWAETAVLSLVPNVKEWSFATLLQDIVITLKERGIPNVTKSQLLLV
jgi:hypothetical protein